MARYKHPILNEYVGNVIESMKEGKDFGSYSFWDGRYREGDRIVSEAEVKKYIYRYFESELFKSGLLHL